MEAIVLGLALCVLGILATYFGVDSRDRPLSEEQEFAELGAEWDETLHAPERKAATGVLDVGTRAAKTSRERIAAALRMLGARVVVEAPPSDVVWPVLRDYPYGPPGR